ncbi:MAG: RDD family protein [Parcubacteria group bacterium]|jgi:uncharacterized RDD family membrane protein YckC|nr:RDD family protein [Candidatus Moranbacteria bacterium]
MEEKNNEGQESKEDFKPESQDGQKDSGFQSNAQPDIDQIPENQEKEMSVKNSSVIEFEGEPEASDNQNVESRRENASDQKTESEDGSGIKQENISGQNDEGSISEPENNSQNIHYAGFWIRYLAYFIDSIVVSIFGIPLFLLVNKMLFSGIEGATVLGSILPSLASMIVFWAYYVYMTSEYQATLGKMAVGIKVVSNDFQKLSFEKVIMREVLGKLISSVTLYVGYMMAGFTSRKRALHDMISGSVVIYKDPNKKINKGVIIAVVVAFLVLIISIIGILASIILVSLNSAREKAYDAGVASSASAALPAIIICDDEKKAIYPPENDGSICDIDGDEYGWSDLSKFKSSWGGCDEDLDLSDGTVQYCATTGGGRIFRCTENGCKWDDGLGDASGNDYQNTYDKNTDLLDKDTLSDYQSASIRIDGYLDNENGASSNITAGAEALGQEDMVAARQQFIWANEKIAKAQNELKNVTPLETEKESYDRTEKLLEGYNKGISTMIEGIDKNDDELLAQGVNIIQEAFDDLAGNSN